MVLGDNSFLSNSNEFRYMVRCSKHSDVPGAEVYCTSLYDIESNLWSFQRIYSPLVHHDSCQVLRCKPYSIRGYGQTGPLESSNRYLLERPNRNSFSIATEACKLNRKPPWQLKVP
jgi:hypothetical protein